MKKTYVKPAIFFEGFTLSTSIAAGCEVKTNTPAVRQCGLDYGPFTVFLDTMHGVCTGFGVVEDDGSGDGNYNGICYHVPTGSSNLFNS